MSPIADKISTILSDTPLPSEQKAKLMDRLKAEGATKEVVEAAKQAIRSYHAKKLLSQESVLEAKDPEVKAANKKFIQELRQITQKFMGELTQIEKEATMLKNDVQDDLTRLEDLVVQTAQKEAN